jgi:hypothetical protein
VTSTAFDRSAPSIKLKHEIVIAEERRELVRIDVWYDDEGLGLRRWFDERLGFMKTPNARVEVTRAGRERVEAISILHPRSYQAPSQRFALLALGDRIVRVTAFDAADERSRALFDTVVESLALEERR